MHQGAIEQGRVICGRDDDTIRVVVLDEVQKRVPDAANLADFVPRGPVRTQRIEFNGATGPRFSNRVEDEPQFPRGLAKVFRYQTVQLNA